MRTGHPRHFHYLPAWSGKNHQDAPVRVHDLPSMAANDGELGWNVFAEVENKFEKEVWICLHYEGGKGRESFSSVKGKMNASDEKES